MAEAAWSALRRILQMGAMAMGSMAAIVTAWLSLGLPTLATREYVDERVDTLRVADAKTLQVVRSVQLEILLNHRDSVEGDIFGQEQALKRNAGDADAARRLRMLQDQLMELNQQISDLRQGR